MQTSLFSQIFTRNMLLCIFTGFSSGLPLYVLSQMVPAWLTSNQVDVKTIGFFYADRFSLHLEIYDFAPLGSLLS